MSALQKINKISATSSQSTRSTSSQSLTRIFSPSKTPLPLSSTWIRESTLATLSSSSESPYASTNLSSQTTAHAVVWQHTCLKRQSSIMAYNDTFLNAARALIASGDSSHILTPREISELCCYTACSPNTPLSGLYRSCGAVHVAGVASTKVSRHWWHFLSHCTPHLHMPRLKVTHEYITGS